MSFYQYLISLLAAAFAVLLLAPSAQAYQHNYTCEPDGSRACQPGQTGRPVVWDYSCVTFYLDRRGSTDFAAGPDGKVSPRLEQLVRRSFQAWNQPSCSKMELIYGGTIDPDADRGDWDRRNKVVFKNEGWSENSATTFATTIVNYNPQTGQISRANIEVNDQFYTFSASGAPGPNEADLQNTLTHEAGHFLGMGHSDVAAATMFGAASLREIKKRTLHRDDIEGLCAYYGPDEYGAGCGGGDSPALDPEDDGSESFTWGDSEQANNESACSVTRPSASSILSPLSLFFALLGGVWWWQRRKRYSDN